MNANEIRSKRDTLAAEIREFRREGRQVNISPRNLARILRKAYRHDLPRLDREHLRRRIVNLSRFAASPIPWHLPCGADDYAAEQRDNARRLAAELGKLYKEIGK